MSNVETRSLREQLKEFIERELAKTDTTSVEKLIRLAYAEFGADEWLKELLVREGLNSLIPSLAAEVRHEHRRAARRAVTNGEHRRERIASVFEHVGFGVSKSILAMNRQEHLFAAEEREGAAAGHLRWAGFHRAVAALHTNNTTPTGDLPPAKVTALWKSHIEEDGSLD